MKINGAVITGITHSPSGQIVAHVQMDDGHEFQMPFGVHELSPEKIVAGVQGYVDSRRGVKTKADELHALFAEVGAQSKARTLNAQVASPAQPLKQSRWRRFVNRLRAVPEPKRRRK